MGLNHVYKVIWSKTKGCYIVVSELAKRVGRNKAKAIVISSAAMAMALSPVMTSTVSATLNQAGTGDNSGVAWGDNSQGTGSAAVAVGKDAKATGKQSVALGNNSKAEADYSYAIGWASEATKIKSIAIGYYAKASHNNSLALGWNSKALGPTSVALGAGSTAQGDDSYAIGMNSKAIGNLTMAFGNASKANKTYDIAIGKEAETRDQGSGYSIAIGYGAMSGTDKGGKSLNGNDAGGVAIGTGAYTGINKNTMAINSAVAVGAGAGAGYRKVDADGLPVDNGTDADNNATVLVKAFGGTTGNLGYFKNAGNANKEGFFSFQNVNINEGTALGRNARAIGDQSVAIGAQSVAGQGSIVIGGNDIQAYDKKKYFKAANPDSAAAKSVNDFDAAVTPGTGKKNPKDTVLSELTITEKYRELVGADLDRSYRSSYGQDGSTVIGMQAHSTTPLGVAIGTNSIVRKGAFGATAIGSGASVFANAEAAVAIGMGSEAQGNYAVAAGTAARAKESAVAAGYSANAEESAVAVGDHSKAVKASVAVGQLAKAKKEADIAVGQGAVASGEQGAIAMGLGTQAQGDSSIMIGGSEITKVANQQVNYQKEKKDKSGHTVIKTTKKQEHIGGETVERTIRSVEMENATGTIQDAYRELTNNETLDTTRLDYSLPANKNGHGSISMGIHSLSTGDLGTAIGTGARVTKLGGVALGTGAISELQNGVAIGTGSKADANSIGTRQTDISYDKEGHIVPFDSKKVAYTFYWAGGTNTSEGDVVSFGTPGAERQLKNVAAGRIADDSTDAINGSQLNSVTKRMSSGWSVEAEKDKDSSGVLKLKGTVATGQSVNYAADGKSSTKGETGTATGQIDKVRLNDEVKMRVGDNLILNQDDASRPVYEDPDNKDRQTGTRITSKFTYSLNPVLTGLTSAEFKNAAGDTTVINGAGVTVTPVTTGKQPVSLTTSGLNNGGNAISNVAGNLPDTKNSTATKGASNATKSQEAPTLGTGTNQVNSTNAATVGDVLNAGWNLQGNNAAVDFVKPYDTVNFINGDGTTATVESTDGKTSTVKYSVNLGDGLEKDANNNVTVKAADKSLEANKDGVKVSPGDKSLKTTKDGLIVNTADKSLEVTNDGLKVKTDGKTITTDNTDGLKVITGDIEPVTTGADPGTYTGTVKVKDNDAGKIATVDTVVSAVNSAAWTATSGSAGTGTVTGTTAELIKAGNTVTFKAGDNLAIKQEGKNFTYSLNPALSGLTSAEFKDGNNNTVNITPTGITITKPADTTTNTPEKTVKLNQDGLDNGGNAITNVKSGLDTYGGNVPGTTANNTGLVDLSKPTAGEPKVSDNTAATVGDIRNMGWIVSSNKSTGENGAVTTAEYSATVKNANEVKFVGEGSAIVSGKTEGNVRTITVKVDDQTSTNNAVTPVVYTDKDGNRVYPTGKKDDDGNQIFNTKPDGKGDTVTGPIKTTVNGPKGISTPTTLSNVEGNLVGAKTGTDAPTTSATAPTLGTGTDQVNKNNAATVGDVLQAGWNLQNNDAAKDFVKPYDTVNFVDGEGTTAVVETTTDQTTSKIKYNVNTGNGLQKDTTGNTISVKSSDKSLTVGADGVKVNPGDESLETTTAGLTVKKADSSLETTTDGLKVKTDGTTITTDGTNGLKVVTGTINNVTTGDTAGTVEAKTGDGDKIATVGNVVSAINNAAWTATSAATTAGELGATAKNQLVKAGDKVTFEADKNIKITQDGSKFTFTTKDNVSFTTVQVGGDQGPKLSKTNDGDLKVSGPNGTDPVKVTNVKSGLDTYGDNVPGTNDKNRGLVDLSKPESGQPKVSDNTAATVGDIRNMGWIVSSNKTTGANGAVTTAEYSATVKNANEVRFVGTGSAIVSGKTENGVRTITVDVDNQVATNKSVTPVNYTKKDGTKVYPQEITNTDGTKTVKFYTEPDGKGTEVADSEVITSVNGPKGTTSPTTLSNVEGNLVGAKTGTDAPTTSATAPTLGTGTNQVNKNNAATVGDVLNAGWNLQGNGAAVDFVKPYDTVNFVNGLNTTAVVSTVDGKTSNVTYNVTGLPITYTDKDGNPVSKIGDKYYKVNDKGQPLDANGNPSTKVNNEGKPVDDDGNVIDPIDTTNNPVKTSLVNPTPETGKTGTSSPTTLDNVTSKLTNYNGAPVNGKEPVKNGLRDLTNTNVTDNTVATVGDIRNMGWVVSSNKTTGANGAVTTDEYSDTVKNANEVKFVGEGSAIVSGKTEGNVRTITVKVDNQTGLNKTVTPVNYTKADGTKVYPQEITNPDGSKTVKFFENPDGSGNEIPANQVITSVNGPEGTTNPTTLSNVKSNLPDTKNSTTANTEADPSNATKSQVAPTLGTGANEVNKNNAATVGDVLNAGWNLQGDGAAVDFVKPYDTVNFVKGDGTSVTVESADGKTSTVKYSVNLGNGLEKDANNKIAVKAADGSISSTAGGISVNVDGTTIGKANDGTLQAITGAINEGTNGDLGKVVSNTGDGNKLATVNTVVNAINNAAWTANSEAEGTGTATGSSPELIKAGDIVVYKAGNNLAITQAGKNFTYSLKETLTGLTSAEFKDANKNTVNITPTGITITKPADTTTNTPEKNVKLNQDGLDNGGNAITNVKANLPETQNSNKANTAADPSNATKTQAAPNTTNATGTDYINPNNAATVGDVLNAGWNLQGNGTAVDFVKPYDTVNFVNGLNTTAVVSTVDGVTSNVTYNVTGLPITYTDKDGNPVSKIGDNFYKVNDKGQPLDANGNPSTKVNNDGKPVDDAGNVINPIDTTNNPVKTSLVNPSPEAGKTGTSSPTTLDNVTSKLENYNDPTVDGKTPVRNSLVDLSKPTDGSTPKVSDNTVATVGDLRNMGWIVSSDKNTDDLTKDYSDIVKNANEVKFVGEGTAIVSGKTDGNVRTITVKVDDQTSTNNAVTPVVYTDKDGNQVYPTGKKDLAGNQIFNTKPDGKGDTVTGPVKTTVNGPNGTSTPTSLSNVKNNIPTVNDEDKTAHNTDGTVIGGKNNTEAPITAGDAANLLKPTVNGAANPNFVGNNAATVSDVLNAGWNLQNNGTAKDFVKPYDTVNFVNGLNTTAVVTTSDDGTTSNVTYNVTGLPVTYTTADGTPVTKIGGKYYKVNDQGQPVDGTGAPVTKFNKDGKPLDATGQEVPDVNIANNPLKTSLVNPTPETGKTGTSSPTTLDNVTSKLTNYNGAPVNGKDPVKNGLRDLTNTNVTDNTVATVGDLRNMGWIVSSDKTTGDLGNAYTATVKNANEVKFVGEGTAVVSGKTDGDVRTITVKVDDQTSTNNAVTPVVYTDEQGNQVYPTGKKDGAGNQIFNTKPDGTGTTVTGPVKTTVNGPKGTDTPTTLSNVEGNLDGAKTNTTAPTTNAGAPNTTNATQPNYVNTHNAATVGDVLQAGWNLQNNGTAKDFVKPYDTVNFVNGANTTAVVTTNAEGTASDVTFNVTGLPVTYTTADGKPVSKVGDKFYTVDESGTPVGATGNKAVGKNATGEFIDNAGNVINPIDTATNQLQSSLVNPNVTNTTVAPSKQTTTPTQLGNVANGAKTFAPVDNKVLANDGKWYNATDVEPNGKPKDGVTPVANPLAPKNAAGDVLEKGNDGKWYKADELTNGTPKPTATEQTPAVRPANSEKSGLIDFNNSNPNNAATIGDLQNMGWVVSAEGNNYSDQVRNANEVKFVGEGTAIVTGKTDDKGVRTITVKVDDQTSTNNAVTPVAYTKTDGTQVYPTNKKDAQGNPIFNTKADGSGDEVPNTEVITSVNGPKGTTSPTTLKNVKNNIPNVDDKKKQAFNPDGTEVTEPNTTTNTGNAKAPITAAKAQDLNTPYKVDDNGNYLDADGNITTDPKKRVANPNYVGNNAATVSDVLNAGWNLQNNGTAKDFVKPYDTVNFVNGGNTTAVVTTKADGTTSDVTFNVTGLPVATTISTPTGPVHLTKVGDNYYPVKGDGTPDIQTGADGHPTNGYVKANDGNYYPAGDVTYNTDPATNVTTITPNANATPAKFGNTLTNPNVSNTDAAPNNSVSSPTSLGNVKNNLDSVNDGTEVITKPDGTVVNKKPNKENITKGSITAEDAAKLANPKLADGSTNPNYVGNNAATVSDVLNAGWNLQNNGTAVDFVKPYDTVNFRNGGNTTVSVTTDDNLTTHVQVNVTGLPVTNTITDGNGKEVPVVKVGNTYYPANADGTPNIQKDATGNPINGYVQANDGKVYPRADVDITNNADGTTTVVPKAGKTPTTVNTNVVNPNVANTDANLGNTVNTPTTVGNVTSGLHKYGDTVNGNTVPGTTIANTGLLDLSTPTDGTKPKVSDNTVATVGDLRNMGWIVSSDKTTKDLTKAYSDTVKNANEVKFVGEGTAIVSGKTDGNVRTITVKVDDQTSTNNSVTPVNYTTADGTKVYPKTVTDPVTGTTEVKFYKNPDGTGDEVQKGDVITSINGPEGTTSPTTLKNVKNNIPNVNDGTQEITKPDGSVVTKAPDQANINKAPLTAAEAAELSNPKTVDGAANPKYIGNNAATVSDVLNAGWNLQGNGVAKDFVKPYDTVNFVNGGNTTAVVTTNAEGTASNVTFNVTGLPMTYTTADGTPVSKIGDKFYKVNDKGQPVDANGKPSTKVNNNGEPLDENGIVIQPINTTTTPLSSTLVNPNVSNSDAEPNKQTTSPTQLGNVTSGLHKFGDTVDGNTVLGTTTANTGLIDLSKPTNGDAPKVSDNTAATVGDLRNMGWIVSSDKTTNDDGTAGGTNYTDQVRNANEVKFVGKGTAIVSGKTVNGVRTITVKVDDQVSTNNAIMPTSFTTKDGKKVYPVKDDAGNVTYHTTPDGKGTGDTTIDPSNVVTSVNGPGPNGTTTPTTLQNVKSNLPNVDDKKQKAFNPDGTEVTEAGTTTNTGNAKAPLSHTVVAEMMSPYMTNDKGEFIDANGNVTTDPTKYVRNPNFAANNAATVGDVLQAGWNLQNNGTAKDFVKPYDTVNFINGLGTTAVVTTREGNTTSDVTFNVKAANSSVTVDEDGVKVTTGEITSNTNGSVTGPTDPATAKQLKDTLDAAVKELATAKDALKAAETALAANPKDPALQQAVADKKADVAAKQTPVDAAQKAHDDAGLNKIATVQNVAEAINNAGFNLKTSADGGEKLTTGTKNDGELIKPGNTVEMVAGNNLTVKQDANGKITYATKDNVTFTHVDTGTLNVGSPNTFTDGKGNTYTKVGNDYYNPSDVENGAPKTGATAVTIPADAVMKPVSPVTMKAEAAKPATNNGTDAQPSSALNITSKDGKPTQITGVGSTLNTKSVDTTPSGTTPGATPNTTAVNLVDLEGTTNAPVNKNAAATVGDLQNMGWVVSAKDGNGYKDVVKNANVVDFKGGKGIEITGNTLADGTREITVGIKEGEVTNKVTITHGDGTKTDAVKIGDNYYKVDKDGKPIGFDKDENGKPAGTPLTIDPTKDKVTNNGAGFVTGNTVANAIQDSGWNIGKANISDVKKSDGTAVDFNKEAKVYDTVNPNDDVKFVDGANANVSMVTVDALNKDGTKKATTFVKVDVNRDLKIDSLTTGGTVVDKNGNNLVKVGDDYYKESDIDPVTKQPKADAKPVPPAKDGKDLVKVGDKYYEAGDVTVVTNPDGSTTATPKANAKPVSPAKDGEMIVKNADGKDVVSATVGKDGSGVFGVNGKDGKDGVSITAKDGEGAIGVNGKDGKNTSITGDNISIKDKDNKNSTEIGINSVTLKDKDGNTSTRTADKSELIDKDGNTNTSTSTTITLEDKDKNTNTSTATGTTYTDKDKNTTTVGPKEIVLRDKDGNNTSKLTNNDLLLNTKDPNTGVEKTSHMSGDKIAFTTTDEIEKDSKGNPVIDPKTNQPKIKNPGNSTEYTNEGLKVIPNSTVARDANGNPTFLDKTGKPVMKDTDGKYKYVGQDGKPGKEYTGGSGSLKPNVVDTTRVISFGMDKPVLDANGNPVKGPDGKTVMTEGISAGMQQIHNVAPGTKDTDAVNVSQLKGMANVVMNVNNRVNRVGAQAAALAGLQSLQYDPLEPTQISAGLGYYKGAGALALGVNHFKNESTMFHMGASFNGRGDETMMNASVTWKFGARADETAVKDTFRQGPISASYTLQDKVSALEAQNQIQKDQLNELRATNAAQKAENEAQREELALMKAQIAELFKRMNG